MAEREDRRERIRKVNPRALAVLDEMDSQLRKAGYRGAVVNVTEDMSHEEQEMALFEGFLTEGYSIEVAAEKAKLWLSLTKRS
jgi:hypothetical protein